MFSEPRGQKDSTDNWCLKLGSLEVALMLSHPTSSMLLRDNWAGCRVATALMSADAGLLTAQQKLASNKQFPIWFVPKITHEKPFAITALDAVPG